MNALKEEDEEMQDTTADSTVDQDEENQIMASLISSNEDMIQCIRPPPVPTVGYWLIHPTHGIHHFSLGMSGVEMHNLVPEGVFNRNNETWGYLCSYLATRCFRESIQVRGNFEVELRLGTFDGQMDLADAEAYGFEAAEFTQSSLADSVIDRPHKVLYAIMALPSSHETLNVLQQQPQKSPSSLHVTKQRFEMLKKRMDSLKPVLFQNTLTRQMKRMNVTVVQKTEYVFDEVYKLPGYRFRKTFYEGNIPGPGLAKCEIGQPLVFSGKRLALRIPTFSPDAKPVTHSDVPRFVKDQTDGLVTSSHSEYDILDPKTLKAHASTDQGVFCDFKLALSSEIVYPKPEGELSYSSPEEMQILPSSLIKNLLSSKVIKNRVQYKVGCFEISFTHIRVAPVVKTNNSNSGSSRNSTQKEPYEDYQIEIEFTPNNDSSEPTKQKQQTGTRVSHTIDEWIRIMHDMLSWYAFFALAP